MLSAPSGLFHQLSFSTNCGAHSLENVSCGCVGCRLLRRPSTECLCFRCREELLQPVSGSCPPGTSAGHNASTDAATLTSVSANRGSNENAWYCTKRRNGIGRSRDLRASPPCPVAWDAENTFNHPRTLVPVDESWGARQLHFAATISY
jgi:hypothetical protein